MRKQPRQLKSGVYAGSFDPLTVGHMWMIGQGARLFDRLTVAVGVNPDKKYTFPLEERLEMLRESTTAFANVAVKRAEILERFLARERIYTTEFFSFKYEQRARQNLQDSIRALRAA